MAIVYKHIRKDTNDVFYIGIGKTIKRLNSTSNRNKYWHNIVSKCGFIAEIIEDGLSWENACEKEKYWISHYGRKDLSEGLLVNMTDGGEGRLNVIFNEATRKKMSENNSRYWKYNKIPEETRDKIKMKLLGHIMSDETKQKISIAKTGKKYTITKIKKSLKSKSSPNNFKETQIGKNHPNYGKARPIEVRQKISKSSLGKKMSLEARNKMSASKLNTNLKPIIQYSLDGIFIKEWESIKSASTELKINKSHISNCCSGRRKSSGGFMWKYKL